MIRDGSEFAEWIAVIAAGANDYGDFRMKAVAFIESLAEEDKSDETVEQMVDAVLHPDIDEVEHVVRSVADLAPAGGPVP